MASIYLNPVPHEDLGQVQVEVEGWRMRENS